MTEAKKISYKSQSPKSSDRFLSGFQDVLSFFEKNKNAIFRFDHQGVMHGCIQRVPLFCHFGKNLFTLEWPSWQHFKPERIFSKMTKERRRAKGAGFLLRCIKMSECDSSFFFLPRYPRRYVVVFREVFFDEGFVFGGFTDVVEHWVAWRTMNPDKRIRRPFMFHGNI